MSTTGWIVLVVVVVLAALVLLGVMSAMQRRRTRGLRDRFGPEYERTVDEQGGRKAGEQQLGHAAERRDQAKIRELDPAQRRQYAAVWADVQKAFVDDPQAATRDADRLASAVMRDRGYPDADNDTMPQVLAADDPSIAEHYRESHALGQRIDEATTEELRRGFVHYRSMFERLLGDADGRAGTEDRTPDRDEVVDLTDRQRADEARRTP
jgi:hypothetical protein